MDPDRVDLILMKDVSMTSEHDFKANVFTCLKEIYVESRLKAQYRRTD